MTPKDGTAGSSLAPTAPKEVVEAANAESGEVSQSQTRQFSTSKQEFKSSTVKVFKPTTPEQAEQEQREISWIEIKLIGEDGKPIPGEAYKVTLPDDSVTEGTLDHNGSARIDGFPPGECTITFPSLDEEAWKDA